MRERLAVKRIRGQALVEVALTLPLLLLLILGAMDFGRMFYTKIILTNAAREGANYLARNYHDTDFINIAKTAIKNEANSSGVTVVDSEITITDCCTSGNAVEVKVEKNVDLLFDNFLQTMGLLHGPVKVGGVIRMVAQ
jgi:Flp pilus assembly protein TadG